MSRMTLTEIGPRDCACWALSADANISEVSSTVAANYRNSWLLTIITLLFYIKTAATALLASNTVCCPELSSVEISN